MYSGTGAKLQAGVQSNFSTIVAQSQALSFTKENLRYVPAYKRRDILTGTRGGGVMDILGVKIEGDFSVIAYPDEIGLLISAVMGAEASPAAVSGSAVYDHVFTPMSAVAASSMPKLTLTVDRIAAVYGYVGCKLDSMTLDVKKLDYLRATFSVRGYDEITDTIDTLSRSSLKPFSFPMCAAQVGGAPYDVEGGTIRFNNNVEDDLFTLKAAGSNMAEIEAQARALTGTLEVLYDTTSDATRSTVFKGGITTSLSFVWTSTDVVLTGKFYTLTLAIPLVYITKADPSIQDGNRLRQTFEWSADENAANPLWTITLRDARATKYIT